MRFIDFINFANEGFNSKKNFNKCMHFFIAFPVLAPFKDAIWRHEDMRKKVQEATLKLLNTYWETYSNLPQFQVTKTNFDYISVDMPVELKESLIELSSKLAQSFSSHPDCIRIEKEITEIIVFYGTEILKMEHNHSFERVARIFYLEGRVPDIHEYFTICLELCDNSSVNSNSSRLSIQQVIGYLSFLKDVISPFKNSMFYTKHRIQAIKLCELIESIFSKIQTNQYNISRRMAEIEAHEMRVAELECKYLESITRREPLPGHSCGCLFNETSEEYAILMASIMGRHALSIEKEKNEDLIHHYVGMFDKYDEDENLGNDLKELRTCLNYWNTNLPKIIKRKDAITKLADYKPDKSKAEFVYRNVSQNEVNWLKENLYFSQSEHSFEREKWFYTSGAHPGKGVEHEYICKIELLPGAYQLLMLLMQDDGLNAAVIRKEAEPKCFGIHEDALPYFNRMIKEITILSKGAQKTFRLSLTDDRFKQIFTADHLLGNISIDINIPLFVNPGQPANFSREEAFNRHEFVKESFFSDTARLFERACSVENELDLQEEAKLEPPQNNFSTSAVISESSSNIVSFRKTNISFFSLEVKKYVEKILDTSNILPTKGGGDCAFHAILGEEISGVIQCTNIIAARRILSDTIFNPDRLDPIVKSDFEIKVVEGIRNLIMFDMNSIKKFSNFCKLMQNYREFKEEKWRKSPEIWLEFEEEIKKYPIIEQYIIDVGKPSNPGASFRDKFYHALSDQKGEKADELYHRILSIQELQQSFEKYNYKMCEEYNWEEKISDYSGVRVEFANFIGTPRTWLAAVELTLIAYAFNKTIHYFPAPDAKEIILNPGRPNPVTIQFDGVNHFERRKDSEEKILSLNIPVSFWSQNSSLLSIDLIRTEVVSGRVQNSRPRSITL